MKWHAPHSTRNCHLIADFGETVIRIQISEDSRRPAYPHFSFTQTSSFSLRT